MSGTQGGSDDDDDEEEDSDFDPDAKGNDQEEEGAKDSDDDSNDSDDSDSDSSDDSGSDQSESDDNSVHGSEVDALMEEAGLSENELNHENSTSRLRRRTTQQQPIQSTSSSVSSAFRKGRPAGRGYVLISESESEEGDDGPGTLSKGKQAKKPVAKAQDDGTLDEANIVSGKRRRKVEQHFTPYVMSLVFEYCFLCTF